MKSRIAFALTAALSFAITACAVDADQADEAAEATSDEPGQLTTTSTGASAGTPGTQTEYTYFRCSLNGGLWLTRTDCQAACAGGTCRLVLICKNGQGQQIPCP